MESEEEALFDKLWRRYYLLLERYAHALLKDKPLEQEALDELFCLVAQNISSIKNYPDPTGWLIETLKPIILRLMEDEVYHSALFMKIMQHSEELDTVLPDNLPPWERWLLTARYERHWTIIKICSTTSISVEKCKTDLYAARRFVEESYALRESHGEEVLNDG